MPSKEQTVSDAVALFGTARYPQGLSAETAWLGIYQVLLWYEEIGAGGISRLLHIIDADKLRPSASRARRGITASSKAWQRKAQAVEDYLVERLGLGKASLPQYLGRLFQHPDYKELQKQNPLGTAFAGLIKHVLETFGHPGIEYRLEVDATTIFPGIPMTGRSTTPSIDILALKDGLPRAVISSKWGVRHDRINEITNECPVYKAAALRMRTVLSFFVVTNEFDPSRLAKILADPCIDAVVHVHKVGVTDVCDQNGRLSRLFDLGDLVKLTGLW